MIPERDSEMPDRSLRGRPICECRIHYSGCSFDESRIVAEIKHFRQLCPRVEAELGRRHMAPAVTEGHFIETVRLALGN